MNPLYSYTYSLPYIVLILVLIGFSYFEKRVENKNVIWWSIGSILVLFFGFRGFVQTDWYLYYWLYERVTPLLDGFYTEKQIEPGFLFITQIFKTLNIDYTFWIFINSLIDVVAFTIIFRRYSASVAWSWVFFICFSGLVIEINLMRNVKAIIIFLLSLPYVQRREFWKFLIVWFVAITIHASSFLYLPAYFVLTKNWGKVWPLVLFVLVNMIFFFKIYPTTFILNNFLGVNSEFIEKALNYVNTSKHEVGISFGYIERLIMFVLVYTLYNRLISRRSENIIFCNAFYIYYTLWYLFSDVPVFVERMPILFAFSYWIICPNMMMMCKGLVKRIVNIFVVCFVVMKVITITDHVLYDYDNLLTGIRSKESRMKDYRRYEASEKK